MSLHRRIVFGTTDIFRETPRYEGQAPVHAERHRGRGLAWYSTGRLEAALAAGLEVYVCSVRPAFGPQDAWWRRLVDPARVFFNPGLFAAAAVAPGEALLGPWRRLYAALGFPWPQGADEAAAKTALIERHGFVAAGLIPEIRPA